MNVTVECVAFRIDERGEIRHAPGEVGGAYVHVTGVPEDLSLVVPALRAACAIPLPVRGRYVVAYDLLEDMMKAGRRVVATRFEG